MMRLQPLTGALALPSLAPAGLSMGGTGATGATRAGTEFDTLLTTSPARQGLPGGEGIVLPGSTAQPGAVDTAAASGRSPASVETVSGSAGTSSSASSGATTPSAGISQTSDAHIAPVNAASSGQAGGQARGQPGHAIPMPLRIGASLAMGAVMGSPIGVIETVFMGLVGELAAMGPDLSRPAVPAGFQQTHCRAGVQPVSPGTLPKGAYLSLGDTETASAAGASDGGDAASPDAMPKAAMIGLMAHYAGMSAYQRRQALEKGIY